MEEISHMLSTIHEIMIFSSSKRGVDFGLARGFSGSQALKHALGLEAARYAGGPGRKKRTDPSAGPMEE